jgi:hypothetical protein
LLSTALENPDRLCDAAGTRHADVTLAEEFGLRTQVKPTPPPVQFVNIDDSELQTAQEQCPSTGSVTALAYCLNTVDETFWGRHNLSLNGLSRYETARLGYAKRLDSGEITKAQFVDGMQKAGAALAVAMRRRDSSSPFADSGAGIPNDQSWRGPPGLESLDVAGSSLGNYPR